MPPLTYIHAIEADRQRDALIAQVNVHEGTIYYDY